MTLDQHRSFGGGKTHALGAMYYLTYTGERPSTKHPAVGEILADAKLKTPPSARVAAVSFDKVDWKGGGEVKSPDGELRSFRMPWNLIAWQLLGQKGIDLLQRAEDEPDYYEPPAESLWMKVVASNPPHLLPPSRDSRYSESPPWQLPTPHLGAADSFSGLSFRSRLP